MQYISKTTIVDIDERGYIKNLVKVISCFTTEPVEIYKNLSLEDFEDVMNNLAPIPRK